MESYVRIEIKGGLAIVEFFHPAGNSLPAMLLQNIREGILTAGENEDVKVILLKSSGDRVFCAGASFEELSQIENEKAGKVFFSGFAGVINAMRTCGKIVIARIQGKAVGGGVGLASAADICYATKYASIRLSELAVGIGPFVIGPAVSRKIGLSAFSYMSLTPDQWQSAEWALEKGLYHHVYDRIDEMDIAIEELVAKLCSYNPEALQLLKIIFWEGTEHWDQLLSDRAAISGRLVLSDYCKKAIAQLKK
jgi:methylglutaconyl-CoA hydratase